MDNLPLYVIVVFGLTTLLTAAFFYKASGYSKLTLWITCSWLILQAFIALSGFYQEKHTNPPRFLFLILPPLLLLLSLFTNSKGRLFIDQLDFKTLILIHIIRIPVEIVLFWLYIHKAVPINMTFEGRNFDILSGITAPIVFYFGAIKRQLGKKIMLIWNFICLGLLINIVVNAVLSAPLPFQQFAFDQPNIAILYFPFIWLPCFVVPVVLLSHLASIRYLLIKGNN
jgi:hypothetical protein